MAITAVAQNTSDSKYGSASLQCTVDLIGGNDNKSKGEAWVDMQNPVDLSQATVSAWVYVPAEAAGNPDLPNGIQLLFKDSAWKNRYSSWNNIGTGIPTGQWTQITVNMATETWAWDEAGFDLTQVRGLGLKIGAGYDTPTQTWSTATFSGTILIDGVTW